MNKDGLLILTFSAQAEWERWLSRYHDTSKGVWVRFYKKASGKQTFTYDEALDEALCYGWIDTLANAYDQDSYIQKFTPRRSKSMWSKRNTEHVTRLITERKMKPGGQKEIEAAKADGRWNASYDSPKNMVIPDDFQEELAKNQEAQIFFHTLNKTNLYAIAWRLQTAKKPETKKRRMKAIVEMLAKGKKLH